MSGYKDFAVVGAGNIVKFILNAFTAKLAEGTISSISLLTRSVCSDNYEVILIILCSFCYYLNIFVRLRATTKLKLRE